MGPPGGVGEPTSGLEPLTQGWHTRLWAGGLGEFLQVGRGILRDSIYREYYRSCATVYAWIGAQSATVYAWRNPGFRPYLRNWYSILPISRNRLSLCGVSRD